MGIGSYPLGCTHVWDWIASQFRQRPPPAHRAAAQGLLRTPDAANAAAAAAAAAVVLCCLGGGAGAGIGLAPLVIQHTGTPI